MAKRKKKSLIDRAFGDDSTVDEMEESSADESEVLDQEQVADVLDQAEESPSADVKPAKASEPKKKTPKALKVRGKDMKFQNQGLKGNSND